MILPRTPVTKTSATTLSLYGPLFGEFELAVESLRARIPENSASHVVLTSPMNRVVLGVGYIRAKPLLWNLE